MKPGATVLTRDAVARQFSRPGTGEADLGALRGGVGRSSRRWPVGDFGVDLDDAAEPSRLHRRQHHAAEERRALDEVLELGEVVLPGHLGYWRLGLRASGVEHE